MSRAPGAVESDTVGATGGTRQTVEEPGGPEGPVRQGPHGVRPSEGVAGPQPGAVPRLRPCRPVAQGPGMAGVDPGPVGRRPPQTVPVVPSLPALQDFDPKQSPPLSPDIPGPERSDTAGVPKPGGPLGDPGTLGTGGESCRGQGVDMLKCSSLLRGTRQWKVGCSGWKKTPKSSPRHARKSDLRRLQDHLVCIHGSTGGRGASGVPPSTPPVHPQYTSYRSRPTSGWETTGYP